mmetsp:Transcript_30138/g.48189  ORF Transcript_30138/g.48189 Transcript_30138/m.48189 type:complete len:113 (-) Transcript_30138:594-932(-)
MQSDPQQQYKHTHTHTHTKLAVSVLCFFRLERKRDWRFSFGCGLRRAYGVGNEQQHFAHNHPHPMHIQYPEQRDQAHRREHAETRNVLDVVDRNRASEQNSVHLDEQHGTNV